MTKEEESIMQTEKNHEMEQSVVTRFLIAGGAIGPLLFIIVLLIEGATRPGYSAWHNYGSSLSLSALGWMQIANFLVCGLLTLDRKSTRLNSSHSQISYAVFCLKKKKQISVTNISIATITSLIYITEIILTC